MNAKSIRSHGAIPAWTIDRRLDELRKTTPKLSVIEADAGASDYTTDAVAAQAIVKQLLNILRARSR
jgi:hypothetical protein